jgi:predicted O-linked N-acetylglucosamine transferase (SPINDLY family)
LPSASVAPGADAWQALAKAQALQAEGDALAARDALRVLAAQWPAWDEPQVCLARILRAMGDVDGAIAAYEEALDRSPSRPEALLGLAATLMVAARQVERAQMLLVRCCGIAPESAEAWDALGVSLVMTDDLAAARSAFAEAQRLAPEMIDYALHRAEAAFAAGDAQADILRLGGAIERDPLDAASLTACGFLLQREGELAAAADMLEAAAALRPDATPVLLLLGRVLAGLQRLSEAEVMLARAIALDPHNPQPRNDRAVMLLRMQRAPEARDALAALIADHGPQPTVLCNLANAYTALGEQDEAVGAARAAIALAPEASLPWRTLCNALPYRAGIGGAELLQALRDCAERLPRDPPPAWANRRDPRRRLRIGLLSGTLKTHPVGWLTVAAFEALDPRAFELVCLSQFTATDSIARRFRAIAAEWHDVAALDDAALARRARTLGIDILIDLGGYGEAARMTACALRLAPVQVKWVGMQNHSSGIPEMDWFITDRWSSPPGFERFYAERLLRLPDGYVCYTPPVDAPEIVPLPMLANGFVTFGCFNSLAKLTPLVVATWARLLRALPDARLVLKSHPLDDAATRARVHAAFAAHAVASERIVLRGRSPHRAFLAAYGEVDLALDPFPYAGGLTTCEALWMGVPVATIAGETFSSRHSTSHLSNVGLADWVADDPDGYVKLVLRKTADAAALARLRAGLREQVRASPLCDAPRFGRHLGEALRAAWQDWCEQRPDRRTTSAAA